MGNRLDFYPRHVKTLRRDEGRRIDYCSGWLSV